MNINKVYKISGCYNSFTSCVFLCFNQFGLTCQPANYLVLCNDLTIPFPSLFMYVIRQLSCSVHLHLVSSLSQVTSLLICIYACVLFISSSYMFEHLTFIFVWCSSLHGFFMSFKVWLEHLLN